MDYENDYILRLIKTMVRALASLIFGKQVKFFEIEQELKENVSDSLYGRLIHMADQGQINEAENLLYDELEAGTDNSLETALAFYDYLNNYSDRFLEEHDYSREEIMDGIRALAVRQGGCADERQDSVENTWKIESI